jgi:hypothetical protein
MRFDDSSIVGMVDLTIDAPKRWETERHREADAVIPKQTKYDILWQ